MVQEVFVPLHGSDWEVYIASVQDHPEADHEDCHECEYKHDNEPNTNQVVTSDTHKISAPRSETDSHVRRTPPQKAVEQGTVCDQKRSLQHIVKNTRKGVVNVNRFRNELTIIFGESASKIDQAFVAYRPRLARIPTEAESKPLLRTVVTLSGDGHIDCQPWSIRPAGAERSRVHQVNIALLAFRVNDLEPTEPVEPDISPKWSRYCCEPPDCDSEGASFEDDPIQ